MIVITSKCSVFLIILIVISSDCVFFDNYDGYNNYDNYDDNLFY